MKRFVISVLVADRVGVLRDITTVLADRGGNIDGISQTVVAGYFTVILTATFSDESLDSGTLRDLIQTRFPSDEDSVVVRDYHPSPAPLRGIPSDAYVITIQGQDRPGILKQVTTLLSSKRINVEDWYVEFDNTHVTHVGEITVPACLDIQQLQQEVRDLLSENKMICLLQHANIFRVTNEVGPVRRMLAEPRHAG